MLLKVSVDRALSQVIAVLLDNFNRAVNLETVRCFNSMPCSTESIYTCMGSMESNLVIRTPANLALETSDVKRQRLTDVPDDRGR